MENTRNAYLQHLIGFVKTYKVLLLLFLYTIAASLTLVFCNGTGGSGDSMLHYQFAKSAPSQPQFFFHHWAKPLFVLLVSPFTQLGFIGIKIFNVLVSLLSIFFTYKIAQKLNIKNAVLAALFLMFSPLVFRLTFSGLTEPLFALFLCMGLYALLVDRYLIACLIISFLPFIRSEGLIVIGVFGLYLLIKQKWKLIPWLLFGHVVYSIAGFFWLNDFLWVFNKIPYAKLSSSYGHGELFHFVEQLIFVIGVPMYILFWVGICSILWKSIKRKLSIEIQVFVFLGFLTFFVAHSLFWYLGIFNSMGLKRVLIGIGPLISIISLMGFNFITEELFSNKRRAKTIAQGLLLAYILIFPFTSNQAAIDWERDLNLSIAQQAGRKAIDFIAEYKKPSQRYILANCYLSEVLELDHFDDSKRIDLTRKFMEKAQPGDLVIWDNWFALVEHGVTQESLDNNPELVKLYSSSDWDQGKEFLYSVYRRR